MELTVQKTEISAGWARTASPDGPGDVIGNVIRTSHKPNVTTNQ